eukprot:UN23348
MNIMMEFHEVPTRLIKGQMIAMDTALWELGNTDCSDALGKYCSDIANSHGRIEDMNEETGNIWSCVVPDWFKKGCGGRAKGQTINIVGYAFFNTEKKLESITKSRTTWAVVIKVIIAFKKSSKPSRMQLGSFLRQSWEVTGLDATKMISRTSTVGDFCILRTRTRNIVKMVFVSHWATEIFDCAGNMKRQIETFK